MKRKCYRSLAFIMTLVLLFGVSAMHARADSSNEIGDENIDFIEIHFRRVMGLDEFPSINEVEEIECNHPTKYNTLFSHNISGPTASYCFRELFGLIEVCTNCEWHRVISYNHTFVDTPHTWVIINNIRCCSNCGWGLWK